MILGTLHDQHGRMIGRLDASENGDHLALKLEPDPQLASAWDDVMNALRPYTLTLGMDGMVVACTIENGVRSETSLSQLIARLSGDILRFQWQEDNIQAAHDLETKIRRQRGKRPARAGDLIELVRHAGTVPSR
ncbi:MAG TPA: hypothetical protein VGY58_11590 [Gemmataceae bacterium]|jgi:hypothetical protein|nr:hypothetical protein [Gemmataceae bacterium]